MSRVPAEPIQAATAIPLRPYFRLKRLIDIVGSLVLIVLLFPILIAASVLVLLDVGQPVFSGKSVWVGRGALS